MTDLFTSKVTIYNVIPKTDTTPLNYTKTVVDKCNIQGGFVDKSNGTTRNVVNATTVISRDITRYKTPNEYYTLTDKGDYYTAINGDYVVFGEVSDIVTTPTEYANLQVKYKNNGIKITNAFAYINDMAIDNVMMTNA